jgi:AraC-like DNA-binding protein
MATVLGVTFHDEVRCTSRLGSGLVRFAASLDVDALPLLQQVGFSEHVFDPPHKRISLDRFAKLLDLLAEESKMETFGLRFAASLTPGDSGILGLAMANAPNLLAGWKLFQTCSPLVADGGFWYFNQANSVVKCVWGFSAYVTNRDQHTDFRLLLGINNVRLFAGRNWYPSEVETQRKTPSDASEYRQMLCPSIRFDCFNNSITFPAELLSATRPEADVRVFNALKDQCESAVAAVLEELEIGQKVQRHIADLLPMGHASLIRVAERMNMGERTMQRKLASRNLRFESLLDFARKELAQSLVGDPQISLTTIAQKCGYSSTSAFSRAFMGWFGKRPHQIRQDLTE